MIAGELALIVAALFTGAAIYINIAEHPARLGLDDASLLKEWKPSYKRGFTIQATLAIIGFALGVWTWFTSGDPRWFAGAIVLLANWPFTLLAIMPTNNELMSTPTEKAGPHTRALLEKWGRLHAVRSVLGALSTLLFLWALN